MTDQDLILDEFDQPQRFEPEYAGFWLRVAAYLIDSIIIGIPIYIIYGTIGGSFIATECDLTGAWRRYWALFISSIFESSEKQATFGKQAVGIIVTDMDGNRITGGQAAGRYFGKIISALILAIGFMMAGFTDKKQALHDIMANTLVVRR
jgi:uncharacterized RDD family membrane protein YckC